MRILGIDYGTKRIGIAVSDESELIARELIVLSPKEFLKRVGKIIEDQDVKKIVVGLPLNMEGKETEKTKEVNAFVTTIKALLGIPVATFDERFSSQMASKLPGGRSQVDSLAAQIILQNYLDAKRNKKS